MATFFYNPLTSGVPNSFVNIDGPNSDGTIRPGPGPGDTVYLLTLPGSETNITGPGTTDLSGEVAPFLSYDMDVTATIANLDLIGGYQIIGPNGETTSTSGIILVNLEAGSDLTVTGTLTGNVPLYAAAADLQTGVANWGGTNPPNGSIPAGVTDFVNAVASSAISGDRAVSTPRTAPTNFVTLTSTADTQTKLTVGTLGGGLNLAFVGGNDLLTLTNEAPATPGTVIIDTVFGGFSGSDVIDVANVGDLVSINGDSFTTSAGSTYTFTGLDLTISGLTAVNDGRGGVEILIACYAEGTGLRTDRGDVPVEALGIGDRLVCVRDRVARPVIWLGSRTVDCGKEPPVRVRAHAFGPNLPARDLVLSPDHAIYFERVLIPVRYLVDGQSIVRDAAETITYWHVELAQHDVILAEGLPAETYLDTGDRASFDGRSVGVPLYAAQRVREAGGCAPLVVAGEAVRRAKLLVHRHAARRAA